MAFDFFDFCDGVIGYIYIYMTRRWTHFQVKWDEKMSDLVGRVNIVRPCRTLSVRSCIKVRHWCLKIAWLIVEITFQPFCKRQFDGFFVSSECWRSYGGLECGQRCENSGSMRSYWHYSKHKKIYWQKSNYVILQVFSTLNSMLLGLQFSLAGHNRE